VTSGKHKFWQLHSQLVSLQIDFQSVLCWQIYFLIRQYPCPPGFRTPTCSQDWKAGPACTAAGCSTHASSGCAAVGRSVAIPAGVHAHGSARAAAATGGAAYTRMQPVVELAVTDVRFRRCRRLLRLLLLLLLLCTIEGDADSKLCYNPEHRRQTL
jgi:hypothetical protein